MVAVSFPVVIPEDNPFGPHNIPFGVFSTPPNIGLGVSVWPGTPSICRVVLLLIICDRQSSPRAGVRLGDFVIELHELAQHGVFNAHEETSKILKSVFLEVVQRLL